MHGADHSRKMSQRQISFPATPEEIDRAMLTIVKPHTTDDSFDENGKRISYDEPHEGSFSIKGVDGGPPAINKPSANENRRISALPLQSGVFQGIEGTPGREDEGKS